MPTDARDGLRGWLAPATDSSASAPSSARVEARPRPLAASLQVTGAPARATWLSAAPPPAPEPSPCEGCGELARLKAELVAARATATSSGRAEGLAETARLRERLASVVAALAAVRSEREAELTETIVDVALGLCEWLAPAAAAIDRRALAPLVAEALAAGGNRDLVLRLCADDAAELGTQIPAGVTCEVVADLAPGEVWVEAPRLVIDARWPTRLAALREPLLALLKAAAPSYELATDDDRPAHVSQRIAVTREGGGRGRGAGRSGS